MTMADTNNTNQSKDAFSICKQNVDKTFSGIKQSVPQYHQAITNVQQECLKAFENITNTAFEFQKDMAQKSGIPTGLTYAAARGAGDASDEIAKAVSVNNQMVLASIDAAQQNVKTFNDNIKSFAGLNRDILRSWISAFSPRT